MPKFSTSVPHNLEKDQVRSRLESFSSKMKEDLGDKVSEFDQSWAGDKLNFSLKSFGIRIKGDLTIDDDQVKVQGDLPITAMMFKGKIEKSIHDELKKLVS